MGIVKSRIIAAVAGQVFASTRPTGSIVKWRIIAAVVGQICSNTRLAGGIVKSRIIAAVSGSFFLVRYWGIFLTYFRASCLNISGAVSAPFLIHVWCNLGSIFG